MNLTQDIEAVFSDIKADASAVNPANLAKFLTGLQADVAEMQSFAVSLGPVVAGLLAVLPATSPLIADVQAAQLVIANIAAKVQAKVTPATPAVPVSGK